MDSRHEPASSPRGSRRRSSNPISLAIVFGFLTGATVAPTAGATGTSAATAFGADAKWEYMTAAWAPAPGAPEPIALTDAELAAAVAQVASEWQALVPEADLASVPATIVDLPGLGLGREFEGAIEIDPTAAGHGWGTMDLLTVVRQELGHVLGLGDAPFGLMEDFLEPGETHEVTASELIADATIQSPDTPLATSSETASDPDPGTTATDPDSTTTDPETTATDPAPTTDPDPTTTSDPETTAIDPAPTTDPDPMTATDPAP